MSNMANPAAKIVGSITTAQVSAKITRDHRSVTHLFSVPAKRLPTSMAAKKELPITPICEAVSPNSSFSGWAARPSTAWLPKLTT